MSDDYTHFNSESNHKKGLIQLGYLVQNQKTHPFSLTIQDLSHLLVVGPRAKDIYVNLLIQLCDIHQIPILVVKSSPSESLEAQICESP